MRQDTVIHTGASSGLAARQVARARSRRQGDRLAGRGDPREHQFAPSRRRDGRSWPTPTAAPDKRHLQRRSRQHRRRDFQRRHPPRCERCLDRARLAGRCGRRAVVPARCRPSTTARLASRCSLPRTPALPAPPRPPIWRVPASPTCASKSRSRNAARFARSLGLGGGTGIGGIVYALTVMATMPRRRAACAPTPQAAAGLITDELIAADKQLDVIGGAAGAILGLLRLYRDTGAASVLAPRGKMR